MKVIIAGSSVGELALHYLNRMNIAVLKVLSKFDLRRLCRVVNATPLARVGAPTAEEAGLVDVFECIEIGGDRVTVLRQLVEGDEDFDASAAGEKTRTATIVLRGATTNHLDDLERAVDDGVNVIKALLKDGRLVPGAGATELELEVELIPVVDFPPPSALCGALPGTCGLDSCIAFVGAVACERPEFEPLCPSSSLG